MGNWLSSGNPKIRTTLRSLLIISLLAPSWPRTAANVSTLTKIGWDDIGVNAVSQRLTFCGRPSETAHLRTIAPELLDKARPEPPRRQKNRRPVIHAIIAMAMAFAPTMLWSQDTAALLTASRAEVSRGTGQKTVIVKVWLDLRAAGTQDFSGIIATIMAPPGTNIISIDPGEDLQTAVQRKEELFMMQKLSNGTEAEKVVIFGSQSLTNGVVMAVRLSVTDPHKHFVTVYLDDASGTTRQGADVPIKIGEKNHPLAANPQTITTNPNTPKPILLTGTDPDNLPLTYAITANPAHGSLSGIAPSVTYTPDNNYAGADSFSFTVTNGFFVSHPVVVSITVGSPPDHASLDGTSADGIFFGARRLGSGS